MKTLIITAAFALFAVIAAAMPSSADSHCRELPRACPQTYQTSQGACFLCTDSEIENLFYQIGLSDSQICTARKLQEKYQQETLSLNDRAAFEENLLNQLQASCSQSDKIREQKRKIKKLEKSRNKICKCYENQFKVMLSDSQWKAYKKYKNN